MIVLVLSCEEYFAPLEEIEGCTTETACNYNADATVDDDSCEYAMENYDCDEICTADTDCAGECGGNAVLDVCGDCDGGVVDDAECIGIGCMDGGDTEYTYDATSSTFGFGSDPDGITSCNYDALATLNCDDCCFYESDCGGVCGGTLVNDACGYCPAYYPLTADNGPDGQPDSGDEWNEDECELNDGIWNSADTENKFCQIQTQPPYPYGSCDCAGVPDGSAVEDGCGVCSGDGTSCGVCIDWQADNFICDTEDAEFGDAYKCCMEDPNNLNNNEQCYINGVEGDFCNDECSRVNEGEVNEGWFNDSCCYMDLSDKIDTGCGNESGTCCEFLGCMDANACNYDPIANKDDGSCENLTLETCGSGHICGADNDVYISYLSTGDIFGFEFYVDGATLISASGGDAGGADFIFSWNVDNGKVLVYSADTNFIPAGNGVLIELDIDNTNACLTDIVISGDIGVELFQCIDELCP